MEILFRPIGFIHSPFNSLDEMPIQPSSESSAAGWLEILPEFVEGLKDMDGFSHIYLIYYLHKVQRSKLVVTPFLDSEPHGVFATRAPSRPNPIGLSLVELVRVKDNVIEVNGLDILNQTPLLDIKPYIPEFEPLQEVRIGWLDQARAEIRAKKSDARFS